VRVPYIAYRIVYRVYEVKRRFESILRIVSFVFVL